MGRATVGYDLGTGKQIQKSITGKTQKEVRQKLSKIITELDEGTYKAPSKLVLKDWGGLQRQREAIYGPFVPPASGIVHYTPAGRFEAPNSDLGQYSEVLQ